MAVTVKKGVLPQKRGRKGKEGIIVSNLNIIAPNRTKQTVSDVRSAHKIAEFVHNPNRVSLYDLYEDCLVDPFLTGVINKRMRMVRNKGLRFVDKQGKHLEELDTLIQSKQFTSLRKYVFNTILYGLTGIEFLPGKELRYKIIPRKHIKPHLGIISRDQHGSEGWDYTNMANVWVLQSDEEDNNFGLLLKALPYVLFKRHGFVNWSEFVEIYGQPTRVGKYDAYDNGTRQLLEEALEKAGRSLAVMIPKQANLEFIDGKTTNSDGKLQAGFKDACDEQMAVLMLGVTGTTKSSGSDGYAQSKTHEGQQLEITQDDMDYEIGTFNDPDFFNILRSYGYNIPEGAKLEHVEEADLAWLDQKLKVDIQIAKIVPIAPDYWYETYKIPKPENPEDVPPPPTEQPPGEEDEEEVNDNPPTSKAAEDKPGKKKPEPEKKKKSLTGMLGRAILNRFFGQAPATGHSTIDLNNLYTSRCSVCGGLHAQPVAAAGDDAFAAITRNIAAMLYEGKAANGYIDNALYNRTAETLMHGITQAFGASSFDYYDNRNEFAAYLQHNIYSFSAAKSLAELKHFNELLIGKDGNPRSRSEFIGSVADAGYQFNKNYLSTEYDTAYSSVQTAMEFNSFGDDDVLQISTAGDKNVRPEHQLLDGFTARKSDKIWQKLCPPFDWYCRCRIIPGVASRITQGNNYDLIKQAEIPPYFQRNAALEKVVFDNGHPYYQVAGGKLKELAAVKNYNLPSVGQLYEDNDFPAADMLESKEAANNWWTGKAGVLRGHVDIQDKSGITVRFSDRFRVHVFEDNTDERWRRITNIEGIITDPDEVWSYKEKGALKKFYIRYYNDVPHVVKVDGTEAATFYPVDKDTEKTMGTLRRGALLYKK